MILFIKIILKICLFSIVSLQFYINNKSIAELEINFKTNKKNELFARAVCIDTEPKVINNCINNGI